MHSADKRVRRHLNVVFDLELLAPSPFDDLQAPMVLTCTFRKWLLRPACGNRFQVSTRNLECVYVCVDLVAPAASSSRWQ